MPRIYLDNHATTRCDPRVVEAMLPWFTQEYGNASSLAHDHGEAARRAVDDARETISAAIGASSPDEIVFTSGATESNHLAIHGVARRARRRGSHLLSVSTEHAAVLRPLERLVAGGQHELTLLDVTPHGTADTGRLDPQRVAEALREETCLVTVMLANNEIGVVQPIEKIAASCREAGTTLHCDATQAVGKVPVDVETLGVDLMSFTAHKLYGPKGIGALFVRGRRPGCPAVRIEPQITGGGQQRGLRGGTLNVPGIVGFAAAVRLCMEEMVVEAERLATLRGRLWERLRTGVPELQLAGPQLEASLRLPHNLTMLCPGVDGEAVVLRLPDIAISSGAACSSSDPEPSHVLRALGLTDDQARSSLRFGLGRFTTEDEIDEAATRVAAAIREVQALGG